MTIRFRRGVVVLLALAVASTPGVPSGEQVAPVRAMGPASAAPAERLLRIMPLGASSTVGVGSATTAGYRGPLLEMLARDRIVVDLVGSQQQGPASVPDRDHEGHSGWTLARMTPAVGAWVRRARPDVVLLHAGTNDLLQGVSGTEAARRLDALLAAVFAETDAHVIVAGVWAPLPRREAERAEFARRSAEVVLRYRALGHSIEYADTAALLTTDEFTDGLHADAAGYRRIAAMWETHLRAHLGLRS